MALIAALARIARRILDVALILLILATLAGVVLGKVVPLSGSQTLAIGGPSMSPAIPVGAAVVVTPVDAAALTPGDVVSLLAGPSRTVFTHRIARVVDDEAGLRFETKGDANEVADPTLVPASDVLGKVTWTIPYAGYLITLLSLPIGVAFVLGLAISLFACAWLLESLELRGAARRSRVLRKVPVWRPASAEGRWPAGPALGASAPEVGVARRMAALHGRHVAVPRPDAAGWVVPGRVVRAARPSARSG